MTDGRSGAAARVLRAAVDPRGRYPLPWAVAPLREAGRVLELGPGVLAEELGPRWRWPDPAGRIVVGAGEPVPEPPTCDVPLPLQLPTNGVDAACLLLVLPWLRALDAVFAELRRVLRPAGTLVVVVPSATVRTPAELRLARLLRPVRRGGWPNRSGLDGAGWLLAAADFAVMGDDRVPFAVPLPDAATAVDLVGELPAAGLWPELPADVRVQLADELGRRAGPGRVLPVPMRRLVARR